MTMIGPLILCPLALLLAQEPSRASDGELATGIEQVRQGDFEGGVLALDAAARRLSVDPARATDAAQAYLYLGVAYVGLGQETIARSKFRQALLKDRALRPRPDEFPAKVLRAFEAAREAVESRASLEQETRKGRGKTPWILAGVGAAGAAGLAVALAGGERANTPPTASLSIAPAGQALLNVTQMTFTATASDAENDPLRYAWAFGDASSAEGATVTHVYTKEGTFTARVTVSDGLASTVVTQDVTVRSLAGRWRFSGSVKGLQAIVIRHAGGDGVVPELVFADPAFSLYPGGGGKLSDPRRVEFQRSACHLSCPARDPGYSLTLRFFGEADPGLDTMTGRMECPWDPERLVCRDASAPATLTRE